MTNPEPSSIADDPTKRQLIEALSRLQPDSKEPHRIAHDQHRIVYDHFKAGNIDDFSALELGMYVTRAHTANHGDRMLAVGYMEWLLPQVRPDEPAMLVSASSIGGFMGGVLSAYPAFIAEQAHGHTRFSMGVSFAGLEQQQQLMLENVLFQNGQPVGDRLLVGLEHIAQFGKEYAFGSLRPQITPTHTEQAVGHDVHFLRALYQAGVTLKECGVDDTIRQHLSAVLQKHANTHTEAHAPFALQAVVSPTLE